MTHLLNRFLDFLSRRIYPRIRLVLTILEFVAHLSAFIFLLSIVYQFGFTITDAEQRMLHHIHQTAWMVFLVHTTVRILIAEDSSGGRQTRWGWLLYTALYMTLLPVIFHRPEGHNFVHGFWAFFHHSYYKATVTGLLSLTLLSGGLVKLMGRRTNPSLILASSFFVIILLGAGLLMLPRSTYHGISWLDALFVSTSATCVTGLTTIDVPATLTLSGQTILMILIQIGGLGVMTFTSFFALFFMGNSSIYSQMVVRDMISSDSLNSLLSTLLYILGFTLVIEGTGAVVIWLSIHDTLGMSLEEELYFSVFHSVSAFCNAGFSTYPQGMSHPSILTGHSLLYLTLSVLILLGGIGFPILVNFKSSLHYYLQYLRARIFHPSRKFKRRVHLYNLNTQIVLWGSAILLVGGTLVFFLLEYNASLAGMTWEDKAVQSFFNAVCPRTAGFSSVSFLSMTRQTLLFYILLMIIGGGTQSTAGGIKINVFAVVLLNLQAVIRGAGRVVVKHRELNSESIRRSNAVCIFYFVILMTGVYAMTFTEKDVALMPLVFECVSALSTVGSSLDLTPHLSVWGKGIIILLMFVGRVGALTLVSSLLRPMEKSKLKYPSDNIIIN